MRRTLMVVRAHKLIKSAGIAALGGTDKVVLPWYAPKRRARLYCR